MKTKAAGPDMLCFEIIRYYDSFPLLSIRCRIDSPEQEETGKAVTRKLIKKAKAFKRYAEKRLFPLAVTAYQNAVRAGAAPHQFTVSFEGMITTRRDGLIGYSFRRIETNPLLAGYHCNWGAVYRLSDGEALTPKDIGAAGGLSGREKHTLTFTLLNDTLCLYGRPKVLPLSDSSVPRKLPLAK